MRPGFPACVDPGACAPRLRPLPAILLGLPETASAPRPLRCRSARHAIDRPRPAAAAPRGTRESSFLRTPGRRFPRADIARAALPARPRPVGGRRDSTGISRPHPAAATLDAPQGRVRVATEFVSQVDDDITCEMLTFAISLRYGHQSPALISMQFKQNQDIARHIRDLFRQTEFRKFL